MLFNLGYNLYYSKTNWTLALTFLRAANFNRKSARYAKKRAFSVSGTFDCFRLLTLVSSALLNWKAGAKMHEFTGEQKTLTSALTQSGRFSVTIKGNGMPDFTPWSINSRNAIRSGYAEPSDLGRTSKTYFRLTGKNQGKNFDFYRANLATGRNFRGMTRGGPGPGYRNHWTWHHHEVIGVMQLVLSDVHTPGSYLGLDHTGGEWIWGAAFGISYNTVSKPYKYPF
jgi:hypothetical protein